MKYLKTFESYSERNLLIEKAKSCRDIKEFASHFPNLFPKSKIKQTLFHGTDRDILTFSFDPDFDRTTSIYDFEIPDGVIFLTSDINEAACYGKYVIPVDVNAQSVTTFEVESNVPSQQFDEDYNYGGIGIYSKWNDECSDVLEVKGYGKSTYVTYPQIVKPKIDLAEIWYSVNKSYRKK